MKKIRFKKFLSLLFLCVIVGHSQNQTKNSNQTLKYGAERIGKRTDRHMEHWRNYGLGQFIHWGVYAIPGGHWKGKYYPGAAEWIRSWKEMPKEAYDELYKQFNPKQFNAKAWARQAKDMGAKYVIITTKHHDGFCLWPSEFTDYTIANTPYKRDIIKQLVEAYDEAGVDVYLYFSIIDWNHPGYRSKIETEEDRVAYDGFKEFTRKQLLELLELYPQTKGLWFDGTWDSAWKEQAAYVSDLDKELRAIIPGLIIGSRFRPDDFGNRHFDANGNMMGDYEQGWERKMPNTIEEVHGNDWDCVMTVPENQWGYHSDWRGHVKTSNELIEMLVKAVSLGGNFVLNFGPDGNGSIREEETTIAAEIGEWMNSNATVIYNCGHLPWEKQDWGYYTVNRKTNEKYMVIFNHPISGMYKIQTPDKIKIRKAYLLENPSGELNIEACGENKFIVHYRSSQKQTKPVVIVIKTDDNSGDPGIRYQKPKI